MLWVQVVVGVVAALVAYGYYYTKKSYRYFADRGIKNLPPYPLFGNFIKSTFLKNHIVEDIDEIYKAFPDEKYVGAYEGFSPVILLRDPELIKKITVKDFDHFADHRDFLNPDIDPLFGGSLLFLKGQKWRDMRATLSPAFTGSKMRHMLPFMSEIGRQIVAHLHREVKPTDQGKVSGELDMSDLFIRYANDVIASCAFGYKCNSVEEKTNNFFMMGKSITQFSSLQRMKFFFVIIFPSIAKFLGLTAFPKNTIKFFHDLVFGTMKYREDNDIHRPDMLQLLMEAKNGTLKTAPVPSDDKLGFATADEFNIHGGSVTRKWNDNELAGQAFIFFFAGFESSSSVLTLAAHELALNPEVQKKLIDEIDECHANHPELTYEVLQSLKYMDMVFSETMRKWSPALIMDRLVHKEYTLEPPRPGAKPVTLKPKDIVYALVNSLHMDEKYFPEPHKFEPERFSDERKHDIKPFTYMPFGVGPRNCIGSRFALMELKVMLYQLLLEFELLACSKTTNPLRLQPHDFAIRVVNGTILQLKARK